MIKILNDLNKKMPPVNKIKTYGRSSKSIVNSSVDAINVLFAKNKAKAKQKKRKFVIKELPARRRGETLLVDDSLHVSTEDTFDKLIKGYGYNRRKPKIGTVTDDSNVSQSFIKQVNSFHSPVMTRRRKRTASIIEVPDSLTMDKSQAKKFKSNKSCSVIPNFLEPTVDKIDFSLEVEKVQKVLPKSLSYIKLPDVKEGEISNVSRREISFDPIFTKTFREKQMIHCSTPLKPMKTKGKIVNHTISPINNATFPSRDISIPTNLSVPLCGNVEYNSENKSNSSDWKLKRTPKVMLSMSPEKMRNYPVPERVDSFQNSIFNIKSTETVDSDKSRNSFITLRKRKILKNADECKRAKKSKRTNTQASFSRTGENLTMSLAEFNSFVDKINGNKHNSNEKVHSLYDFESFVSQNNNLASVNTKEATRMETPMNYVTKRRRRLTDSHLSTNNFPANESQIPKRRFSLQESTCNEHPDFSLKDLFVLIPRSSANFNRNKTDSSSVDINSLIPMIDRGSSYFQGGDLTGDVSENPCGSHERYPNIENFSNMNKMQFKQLVVNLTQANLESSIGNKYNSTRNVTERSKSLFEQSDKVTSNTSRTRSNSKIKSNPNKTMKRSFASGDKKRNSSNSKKTSGSGRVFETVKTPTTDVNSNLNSNKKPARSKFVTKRSDNKPPNQETSNKRDSFNDNVLETNPNVPEIDFEKFFVNVTKRSGSKQKDNSSKISDTNKIVTDAEKFESFFLEVSHNLDQLTPDSNEINSVISETHSENLNKVNSKEEFDNFFVDVMRSASESETHKFVMNEDHNTDTTEEKGKKEVVINLVKSPWRWKSTSNTQHKSNGTVIDLTEKSPEKSKAISPKQEINPKPKALEASHSTEISDIIESSILESSQVDGDVFKMPLADKTRQHKRQSKTLLLKAGKLWRRSLSVYKRSSMMLDLLNAGTCCAKDGGFCYCPKCNMSRCSKRLSHRRCSIKIVPASPAIDPHKEASILENYAHNASYVSDQILEDNLENNLRSLSIIKRRSSIIPNSAPVTAKELVLRRCGQSEPIPFELCYPKSVLQHCQKIGEGVYGEVFLFRNPNGGTSVMKVIPIEGDQIVNGERQKKFEEIFSEIIIAQELSNLRNNKQNMTGGFAEVQKVQCVQGRYPEKLLDLWELFDETRGSENDSPETFGDDQLYIVLQLANGGQDLEAFAFNNALQAYTMFQQVACALAIAEEELSFEHRDLHWGNILLSAVDKNKKVNFRLGGKNYAITTKGVEVSIIDFTLSRIEYDGVVIFNDLGLDPDLFTAEGDYQFEIYKLMQKKNGNNWQRFEPYTNILWLHYTLDKAVTALRYKSAQTKVHKEYIGKLKRLKNDILSYGSVKEFVSSNF